LKNETSYNRNVNIKLHIHFLLALKLHNWHLLTYIYVDVYFADDYPWLRVDVASSCRFYVYIFEIEVTIPAKKNQGKSNESEQLLRRGYLSWSTLYQATADLLLTGTSQWHRAQEAWCTRRKGRQTFPWSCDIERKWNQVGTLRTTFQDPPRIRKTATFIVIDLFVSYSVMCPKTCRFYACLYVTINVYFYISTLILHVMSSQFCLCWFIFVAFITHLHTCIYRRTHTRTHSGLARTRSGEKQTEEPGGKEQR